MAPPLQCALIGIGARARKLYLPLAASVAPWLRIAAVCSPNPDHAREAADRLGVPAFASVEALARAGVVEAAIVLSPIESHHAVSVFLSRSGIHHLVETSMCSLLVQAREMEATARDNGVVMLVAENYFRFPFDRLAKLVARHGAIGEVGRLSCWHDQVGFHGTARWIKFFDAYPEAAQAVFHVMPTARHVESPRRIHDAETFRSCYLHFPGGRMALDMGGNLKGMLGRAPRPGHTEIDGGRGAIARIAGETLSGRAEVRVCSDGALADGARADHVAPFVDRFEDGRWVASHVDLPDGRLEWVNRHRPATIEGPKLREWDAAVVMEILVQFARQVRGGGVSEFSAEDAVRTTEVEAALRESALRGGIRIDLPLGDDDLGGEHRTALELETCFGIDPFDAEAMMRVHFPAAA